MFTIESTLNNRIPLIINTNLSKSSSSSNKSKLNIDIFHQQSHNREIIEQFIIDGYKSTYNADINIYTELLITLCSGVLKAALGLKQTIQPLFCEQYLPCSIENIPFLVNKNTTRADIKEEKH